MTDSIRNAQINHGISEFTLGEEDLEVKEKGTQSAKLPQC